MHKLDTYLENTKSKEVLLEESSMMSDEHNKYPKDDFLTKIEAFQEEIAGVEEIDPTLTSALNTVRTGLTNLRTRIVQSNEESINRLNIHLKQKKNQNDHLQS